MQPECRGQKAAVRNFLDRYTGRLYTPVAVEQSKIIYLPNTLIFVSLRKIYVVMLMLTMII